MDTPLRLIPLLEPIRPEMEQLERLLCDAWSQVRELLGSTPHILLAGGKRFRPALAVLVGRMFAAPVAPFLKLGAAIEMLHTGTLIHDDLVDSSPVRRGQETMHMAWPVGPTVLAGDYLLGLSTSLVADLGHPLALKCFGETLRTICAGEIEQASIDWTGDQRREAYYRCIEAKTASLCAATTAMAGMLAGAGEAQAAALRDYGRELGVAYQIVDDVLDLCADVKQSGKPVGNDLRRGLMTLPVLCYLESVAGDVAVNAVLSGQRDAEHVRTAIETICASRAIDAAMAEARAHARHSQRALATMPDNDARQMLCSLAEYVVERKQ